MLQAVQNLLQLYLVLSTAGNVRESSEKVWRRPRLRLPSAAPDPPPSLPPGCSALLQLMSSGSSLERVAWTERSRLRQAPAGHGERPHDHLRCT